MNKITAAELRTILVLYQTKSFTLTGKVLHKVPTAISYTLNTLEKRLQIKLFNKDNKKLIPTVAGKYLAGKAAQLLEEMDSAIQNTRSLAEDFEPDLKIAVNNIICLKPLYDLCKESSMLFPDTQINLTIEVYNGVWESLFSDKADIVVGAPHSADVNSDLDTFRLGVCNWLFCVSPTHPLTKEIFPLSNEALSGNHQFSDFCTAGWIHGMTSVLPMLQIGQVRENSQFLFYHFPLSLLLVHAHHKLDDIPQCLPKLLMNGAFKCLFYNIISS